MDKKTIKIYCDGGCRMKSSGEASFASVVLVDGEEFNEFSQTKVFDKGTNNQMELFGYLYTMKEIIESDLIDHESVGRIEIISDSQYLIKGVNEYLPNWSTNGWLTYAKKPIKNIDIWKSILVSLHLIKMKFGLNDENIEFKWTKGHSGDDSEDSTYNEMCDNRLNESMDSTDMVREDYEQFELQNVNYFKFTLVNIMEHVAQERLLQGDDSNV